MLDRTSKTGWFLRRFRCVGPGVSPYILGEKAKFSTRHLTLEFKNNLDALISEIDGDSPKTFNHIDICVCWSVVGTKFEGYLLEEIADANIDERKYPGVTHVLRKDGDGHAIQVVMLQAIVRVIEGGTVSLTTAQHGGRPLRARKP
jgi:hypothetical protein